MTLFDGNIDLERKPTAGEMTVYKIKLNIDKFKFESKYGREFFFYVY